VIDATVNANLTAIVVLSMALTPLFVILIRPLIPKRVESMDGIDVAENLSGTVLVIGFGRFGQVMSQCLLARGCEVTIIDTDVEMIRSAADFGFIVYYGDGTRLDVLRASGAPTARAIAVCVDNKDSASLICELVREEFPHASVLVRAYDREHAAKLVAAGADFQIRETFESALRFGEAALRALGVEADEAAETAAEVRRRDAERFELEVAAGDVRAGRSMMLGNAPRPVPTPFTAPRREARPLTPETAAVTRETAEEAQ